MANPQYNTHIMANPSMANALIQGPAQPRYSQEATHPPAVQRTQWLSHPTVASAIGNPPTSCSTYPIAIPPHSGGLRHPLVNRQPTQQLVNVPNGYTPSHSGSDTQWPTGNEPTHQLVNLPNGYPAQPNQAMTNSQHTRPLSHPPYGFSPARDTATEVCDSLTR